MIGLRYIHSQGLIHCDLKPENLVMKHISRTGLTIIDFGSSQTPDGTHYEYLQSRYYRAPEVILSGKYTYPIDIWSLGCILCELRTGKPIFDGFNESEQLHIIMSYLGEPPVKLLLDGKHTRDFY